MTNKTKLYSSLMAGAPVLNGVAGSMIALLDAVAVNGFGVTAVVSLSVTDGIATATFSAGHPFIPNSVGAFTGATPAGLNGDKRILAVAANSVTFDATGIANGAATGSLSAKVAPLGWAKAFAGVNLASYKMVDPQSTGFSLRMDDTGTTAARVRGFEAMTDVDTGTGLFPTLAQFAAPGEYWSKSNAADASARAWYVVGDSRGFYLFVNNAGAASAFQCYYFGDVLSLKSNDPYACILRANTSNQSATTTMIAEDLGYADASMITPGMYVARAPNTLGGAVSLYSNPVLTMGLPMQHISGSQGWPYPSQTDNGLMLSPVMLANTAAGYRGYLPGLRTSPQYTGPYFNTGDYVQGSGAYGDKKVIVIKLGAPVAGAGQGVLFMDPIADWRS